MARSTTPAAGSSGGRPPYPATIHVPDFLRVERLEIATLYQVLCDPLVTHLYGLLLLQMRFTEGHFLSTYARLIELMTPPRPERGRRRRGPSYKQVRSALDALVSARLVRRGQDNEAQGQLRLWLAPRSKPKAVKPPTQPPKAKPRPRH